MLAAAAATLAAGLMTWRTATTGRAGECALCLALLLAGMVVMGAQP